MNEVRELSSVAEARPRSHALAGAPALIERLLPAQKLSAEAQKERKAVAGQTLTALGSYWKGRKPLILARACILGALLPATDDPEADLAIFEKLMAIDDEAFLRRRPSLSATEIVRRARTLQPLLASEIARWCAIRGTRDEELKELDESERWERYEAAVAAGTLRWRADCPNEVYERLTLQALSTLSYLEKVGLAKRPEEIEADELYGPIWNGVNAHLGTTARSFPDLAEQLGILRWGRNPRVGDSFCGAGSIPFEAARLGCDVYASDLNPIGCMLTWGALNVVGGDTCTRERIADVQRRIAKAVDEEITELRIEHDEQGNRAKAYLWCLEARCPRTGWLVPMAASWVISRNYRVCARLIPDRGGQRFEIEIVNNADDEELEVAARGTVQDRALAYELDGETHRTPIATLRGDFRLPEGVTGNSLRPWAKEDFVPRPADIFRERLYCIQWITADTVDRGRPRFFFAAPTEDDSKREQRVEAIVHENLARWQEEGLVPDWPIVAGEETTRLLRERGWTHWRHLFPSRHLLIAALIRRQMTRLDDPVLAMGAAIGLCRVLTWLSRLTRWNVGFPGKPGTAPSADTVKDVFYNQALNTYFNYGARSFFSLREALYPDFKSVPIVSDSIVNCASANETSDAADIWVTDPPYADAISYHEITEYFIAWLRKNPPWPNWVWDSRRALAIRGEDETFRRGMIEAYRAMAEHMPDDGLQIIFFTHQDARVWTDMAAIMWGAGLHVTAAWYVATETTSEIKKGGYVQGTVLLVVRKRRSKASAYRDELSQELREEVARQVNSMVGLNQALRGHGRVENLFEDADLQMAGFAAALRVLTGYTHIDGIDMTREALRPRAKGERGVVSEIIEFTVQIANEYLVPDGLDAALWEKLTGVERFYLKMLDIEATGARKLDNYQNFAKAFRVPDHTELMGAMKPNAARLKTAAEFKRDIFGDMPFGRSNLRSLLYALLLLQKEQDESDVLDQLHDLVQGYHESYHARRPQLMAMARYIAAKRARTAPSEAQAARILEALLRNERLS